MWHEMGYREDKDRMFDDFSEDALERAYRRGMEAGYRKAMQESGSSQYGERSWHISEDRGYGQRGRDSFGRFR